MRSTSCYNGIPDSVNCDSIALVFGVAVALGCDAFSVGLALGTRSLDRRASFRLWFHFGLFQFLMPLIGWCIGKQCLSYVADYDHWVAFAILSAISVKMLIESLKKEDDDAARKKDPTRGWSLVGLSLATSMDALGVGCGMGVVDSLLLYPAICIGITAGVMTYIGIRLGCRLSGRFGKRVETVGALILLAIAIKLLEI